MAEEQLKIVEITGNDTMRVIVEKLNRMLKVVQEGVAVKLVENFTATQDQQEFTLKAPYTRGTNYLDVYVNGVKQREKIDYTEKSDTEVSFNEPLLQDDVVVFEWFVPNGEVLMGKVDIGAITNLPDGSIPYEKISFPDDITKGDIDGGTFSDPRV